MSLKSFVIALAFIQISLISHAKMVCPGGYQQNSIAWSFGNTQHSRFNSDLTEPRNAGVPTEQKVSRVLDKVNNYPGEKPLGNQGLSELIVHTAECTGHDFSVLAGLIEHESDYCSMRKNRAGSGATGCGQFTASAVDVFKNQLRLRGQQKNNNASSLAKESIEDMIYGCYTNNPERASDFIDLFNGSTQEVKQGFLENVDMDLLATAIYLKFLVAVKGGYTIPGSSPGALASYGDANEGHYYSDVMGFAQKVQYTCYEDTYAEDVLSKSCSLGNDPGSCHQQIMGVLEI